MYDIEVGLVEAAKFRLKRDEASRAQVALADKLAWHLTGNFLPGVEETAGLALVVGAASVAALAENPDVPSAAIVNILALAGQRLVSDARDAAREVRDDRTRDAAGRE